MKSSLTFWPYSRSPSSAVFVMLLKNEEIFSFLFLPRTFNCMEKQRNNQKGHHKKFEKFFEVLTYRYKMDHFSLKIKEIQGKYPVTPLVLTLVHHRDPSLVLWDGKFPAIRLLVKQAFYPNTNKQYNKHISPSSYIHHCSIQDTLCDDVTMKQ